ncbi:MAG: magnesium transporter [Clostridiales bacterium]|jgi:magnesium transporter|nr:magnesium transporter [Clostridiales bacterium]
MTLYEKIMAFIESKDMENLKTLLANSEEIEILDAFYDLSNDDQVIVFRLLAKDSALSMFEQLDIDHAQNLLRSFTDERVIEFINEMAPDDRVKLLDEMPASVAKKLIASLSPQERATTNILMGYEAETAGRIMTTEYISLNKGMTAQQALDKVRRQAADKETIYTLFVTDNAKKLEGVLSLKDLLVADSGAIIGDIMSKKTISAFTGDDQEEVAKTLQELDLLAIPVVDKEGRIVGIVTIDDAVDIFVEEATEDILDHAGFADAAGIEADRSEVLVNGNLWRIWRVRVPILLITLVFGFLTGAIIDGFEQTLQSVAAVAVFIPLIMGMAGNVGTQSSTIFARGVVLGHIQMKSFVRHLAKEIGVGLSIGIVMGSVTGLVAALWQGNPQLGLAVGLALVATMAVAALLGFAVPYFLIRFNMDQAAGSAPIITSIKDIAGLVIYFAFVSIFMANLL